MFNNDADARAFLSSVSDHPDRPGDTSFMHPDFAIRLANSIQQMRANGYNVGLMSGYRAPTQTGTGTQAGRYDAAGKSSHTYGLAADIRGLDKPNGPITNAWANIAAQNGLHNPYGVGSPKEYNHWQLPAQPLETTPDTLNALRRGYATGSPQNVWNAWNQARPSVPGTMVQAYNSAVSPQAATRAPASPQGGGEDNRQAVFSMFRNDLGLTPNQALGALWSLGGESYYNLRTGALNPNDPGGAFGIGQWVGSRRTALNNFAASLGKPPSDLGVQLGFIKYELTQGDKQGVLAALKQAQTPQQANAIWTAKYEVPSNAAAKAAQRAAAGPANVGTLDAQGNLVLGKAAPTGGATQSTQPAGGTTTPSAPTSEGAAPVNSAPAVPYMPGPTPGMQVGQMLANLAAPANQGGAGGEVQMDASRDQQPIQTAAMMMSGPQAPSPLPPEYQEGAPHQPLSPIGTQLAGMNQMPAGLMAPDSITAGAPSMTALLKAGTPAEFNYGDPRRTVSPTLAGPQTRFT